MAKSNEACTITLSYAIAFLSSQMDSPASVHPPAPPSSGEVVFENVARLAASAASPSAAATTSTRAPPLPKILILGGCGYIGRNFVHYVVSRNLASFVRVVDKMMPVMAYLHPDIEAAFNLPHVQFIQGDLTSQRHLDRAFEKSFNGEPISFDVVFNLAAETRQNQDTSVYEARCTTLSTLCATMAQKTGIPRFIEVSTAAVYKSQSSSPSKETSAIAPCGRLAAAKRAAEVALQAMTELKPIIVRPAMVYGGTGDTNGVIFGRMICASVYSAPAAGHSYEALSDASKGKRHKMTLLWDGSLKLNTVHVLDVCRGLWTVFLRAAPGSVWNLCDKNDTDQAKLCRALEEIFDIDIDFYGSMMSNLARLRLGDAAYIANDKHLKPWDSLCRSYGVTNTPLSPIVSAEILDHYHCFVDGSGLETSLGFSYERPSLAAADLRESLRAAVEAGVFPNMIIKGVPLKP